MEHGQTQLRARRSQGNPRRRRIRCCASCLLLFWVLTAPASAAELGSGGPQTWVLPVVALAAALAGSCACVAGFLIFRRHAHGLLARQAGESRATAALEAEIHRRKVLMEQSNDGIAIINQEHVLVEVNRKFADMLGYTPESLTGLHTWDFEAVMSEADIRSSFHNLQHTRAIFETVHRRKDGTLLDVEVSASGTQVLGENLVLCVIRDITDRKQREQLLREAKEKAEAASLAKSEFLATMSHEFRTPLNGVMGMLQLLQSSAMSAEQHQLADVALASCNRLTRLLSDMLDLANIEAGSLRVKSEPLDLGEELNWVRVLFAPTAAKSGIEFHCMASPNVPRKVLGDAARLRQVLTNIVGNALKFTHAGHVAVEAYRLPPRRPQECRVLFTVADTGIGIPDAKLPQLFAPFSQVSQGYARAYQGAGLGLALCKRLVQRMGGNIAVESEEGVGTTVYFCITFGLPDQEDAISAQPEATPGTSGVLLKSQVDLPGEALRQMLSGLGVLLVEGDPLGAMVEARLLEKLGARTFLAEDLAQALELLQRETVDVALLDMQEPDKGGAEALSALRKAWPGVPVIVLTTDPGPSAREELLAAGAAGLVVKPLLLDALLAAMARALPVQAATATPGS